MIGRTRKSFDSAILIGMLIMSALWLIDVIADSVMLGSLFSPPQRAFLQNWHVAIGFLFCLMQAVFIVFVWRILRRRTQLEIELEGAKTRAEQEERRTAAVIDAIGDGVTILDRDFRVLYQNRIHQEMVGGDWRGEYCYRVYNQKENICEGCPVDLAFRDGEVHTQEKVIFPSHGEPGDIEITASPLRDTAGEIVAGIEVVRDISTRKKAEKTAREHTEFLQSLMNTIPNPIFYKDAAGVYLGCNDAFARVMGLERDQIVGRSVYDLAPRALAEVYSRKDAELFADPGTQIYETSVRYGDGSLHEVLFNKATYNDAEGRTAGLVGVIVDISERKRVETEIHSLNQTLQRRAQELSAANDELEAFSYSLSHDLRLPLTRIYTAAQLLSEKAENASEEDRFLVSNICEASEKMEELIGAMLVLFRISRAELNNEKVDLGEIASDVAGQLKMQFSHPVECRISPGMEAYGDSRLLKALLENLMGNAWKYTQRTGNARVEVGTAERDGERLFFVRDNGVGFDMADAGKLFKPFQRLPSASEFPGTGVGLATVQQIVQRHGGRLWAESVQGKGATFYFTLPSTDLFSRLPSSPA